jgi:hypothetical protein
MTRNTIQETYAAPRKLQLEFERHPDAAQNLVTINKHTGMTDAIQMTKLALHRLATDLARQTPVLAEGKGRAARP